MRETGTGFAVPSVLDELQLPRWYGNPSCVGTHRCSPKYDLQSVQHISSITVLNTLIEQLIFVVNYLSPTRLLNKEAHYMQMCAW